MALPVPTWSVVWHALVPAAGGLLLLWVVLLLVLVAATPDGVRLGEAVRLLPDVLRLVRRLASDRSSSLGVRVRLALLLLYLASPVDLVPDVIPVLGQVDDAVAVLLVLRSVVRSAGPEVLERHWPGGPGGLSALRRLLGV